jgi:radical SAM protein with 4Fe4S-binding SPASM domain
MRVRVESFGAWVSLDDSTLVALDRRASLRAGIDGGAAWRDDAPSEPSRPIEMHVAVTSRCPVACSGCYQDAGPDGHHVSRDALEATLRSLAAAGVFTVAFGGGEPLAREDLAEIGALARSFGLTPVVTTSGLGLTAERAAQLRVFAQVNVSHDGVGGAYRAVRGFDAANTADRAIKLLADADVPVGVNLVLTRESFEHVEATAAHVHSLGARELQLLRYKPAGRAASLDYLARRLSPSQNDALHDLLERLVQTHGESLSVRIDCALIPMLVAHVRDARALARWGVFGCEAGRHLAAVQRDGAVVPCSFVTQTPANQPSFDEAWRSDPALESFRGFVAAPPEPCASCALRSVCRGGCKVVSSHLAQAMVPDPECPRVRALAGAGA